MPFVLQIEGISKKYGRIRAVNELNLRVEQGSVYGILGPNGSGKTTTLGIILGVICADRGTYRWFGEPPSEKSRRRIGSLLETPYFYPYLTAVQNLRINAAIKGVSEEDIPRVLEATGLWARKDSQYKTYSTGMKQRLGLAAALLGNPEVLVLDEPTNGLDPQGIAEVRELIIREAKNGKTIILASHLLDEVEKVCTHVAVLHKGNLLAAGEVRVVLSEDSRIEVAADDMQLLEQVLRAHEKIREVSNADGRLLVKADGITPAALNYYLSQQGIIVSHLILRKKTLETQFLEMVKE